MGWKHATMRLCTHALIIMCAFGIGSKVMARGDFKETSALRLRNKDMDINDVRGAERAKGNHHNHDHMSHMGHMDPSLNVFLVKNDLKVGRVMPIYFPNIDPSSSPHFLPRQQADSIPFSSDKLPYLLQFFSFSEGSPQAEAMDNALRQCEVAPVEGESKICATSLESMLDFARSIFGVGTQFKAVTTIHSGKRRTTSPSHPILHNYTILNISELSASKMVACHTMPYPYTIFYCHHQVSKSKVFRVTVSGESDEEVAAVVVCHMDTSAWNPGHVSFVMLGIKPGTDPVCHFFPADHLVWVPSTL